LNHDACVLANVSVPENITTLTVVNGLINFPECYHRFTGAVLSKLDLYIKDQVCINKHAPSLQRHFINVDPLAICVYENQVQKSKHCTCTGIHVYYVLILYVIHNRPTS